MIILKGVQRPYVRAVVSPTICSVFGQFRACGATSYRRSVKRSDTEDNPALNEMYHKCTTKADFCCFDLKIKKLQLLAVVSFLMAGETGLEPATNGFGVGKIMY